MIADRYTKTVLTIIAVALTLITVQPWLPTGAVDVIRPNRVQAETATPKFEVTIPKSWGKYVSYSNNNLLLETPDGSMRIVDVEGKAPEYPKVKALIHWQ